LDKSARQVNRNFNQLKEAKAMSENKTHYRKVFKSDHLGVADLEDFKEAGSNLIFTISHVKQEQGAKVAGKTIDANIAYFNEKIKPLVLNATNSKTMRTLTGSCFVEDWCNIPVMLYIDKTAALKGQVVGGVRISPNAVQKKKKEVTPTDSAMWAKVKAAYMRDGNFNSALEKVEISEANMQLMMRECNNV